MSLKPAGLYSNRAAGYGTATWCSCFGDHGPVMAAGLKLNLTEWMEAELEKFQLRWIHTQSCPDENLLFFAGIPRLQTGSLHSGLLFTFSPTRITNIRFEPREMRRN